MTQTITQFANKHAAELAKAPWFKHSGQDRATDAQAMTNELGWQLFNGRHVFDKASVFRAPKRRPKPTLAEIIAAAELLADLSASLREDPL